LGVSTHDNRKKQSQSKNPTFIIHNDESFQKIQDDIINNPMNCTTVNFMNTVETPNLGVSTQYDRKRTIPTEKPNIHYPQRRIISKNTG